MPTTTSQPELVIATQNPGKIAELRALLRSVPVRVIGLDDAGGPFDEPPETGRTFEANAALKAVTYAELTGRLCLADDSGLEIDALDGRPGVDSAWYAYASEAEAKAVPREIRDPKNIDRVMTELDCVPAPARTARFVCCMALASPDRGSTMFPSDSGTGFQPVNPCVRDPESVFRPNMSPINKQRKGVLEVKQGDLPHWHPDGATYFITFRVHNGELTPVERDIVLNAVLHWHGVRMFLHLVVVMPDHVHMLMTPLKACEGNWHKVPAIMHSIKSFTANSINQQRGSKGAFWMPEYFDRLIRNAEELVQKRDYMLDNPVKVGLVEKWSDYPWTRCGEHRLEAGPTGDCALLATTRGTFEGRIGLPPRVPAGANGFGYDPVFLVGPDHTRTSAELSPSEKNAGSHRAVAAQAMVAKIITLFSASS